MLMVSKIWFQVGELNLFFPILPYVREFLNIWFQKLSFFFLFLFEFSHFFENLKNVIYHSKLKKMKYGLGDGKTL